MPDHASPDPLQKMIAEVELLLSIAVPLQENRTPS